MKRYAISGAKIFDGYKFLENKAIVVNGNVIEAVVDMQMLDEDIESIDLTGKTISAGFIDLQINGCGGVLYNDDISEKTLEIMHKTCLRYGCTSFIPTLITTTDENIRLAVETAEAFYKKHPWAILGVHIEGPYISKAKRGAHNADYIKPIDAKMVDFFCDKVKNIPIVLTMAPENNDSAFIRRLAKAGVKVSLGHTNATYEEAMEGIASGMSMATHIFNAMSPLESRAPGAVGALLNSHIYGGIIVDGIHSSFDAVSLVKKIKQDRVYIVTDAVTPMGTDIKEFYLADQKVRVVEGRCINESGALAGSNIDMASSVRNAVAHAGIPAAEALRMATLYPATVMGRHLDIGAIQPGMIANFAVFDENYNVTQTTFQAPLDLHRDI